MQSNDQQWELVVRETFLVMDLLTACGVSRADALIEGWRVICMLLQTQQPVTLEQVRQAYLYFRDAVAMLNDSQVSPRSMLLQQPESSKKQKRGRSARRGYVTADEFEREDE